MTRIQWFYLSLCLELGFVFFFLNVFDIFTDLPGNNLCTLIQKKLAYLEHWYLRVQFGAAWLTLRGLSGPGSDMRSTECNCSLNCCCDVKGLNRFKGVTIPSPSPQCTAKDIHRAITINWNLCRWRQKKSNYYLKIAKIPKRRFGFSESKRRSWLESQPSSLSAPATATQDVCRSKGVFTKPTCDFDRCVNKRGLDKRPWH